MTGALALAFFLAASAAKLPPVDQCSGDTGFKAFHASLSQAVAKRDGEALLALLAPDVTVNFGGDSGREAFAKQWEVKSKASQIWPQLGIILPLGCARVGEARVIPSLAGQFDSEDDEDVFEKLVVISDKAELRAGPERDSKVVAKLAWDVVTAVEASGDILTKVRLADGREGWLPAEQLYSPLDYRAVVEKRGDEWMITAFVAGD